jgi:probable O-glycosylation ligase (exosortase A-associated)
VGAQAVAAAKSPVGRWSIAFIGVLGYVYAAVTYGLPIVTPSIIVAVLGLAFERNRIVVPFFLIIFAMYIGWTAAGWSASWRPQASADGTETLAKVLLIAFVIVNVTRDAWRIRAFMIFFLACFAAYPTRGTLFNYFIAGYTWFGRALWNFIYNNSNDLAALTFFPLSLCLALAITEKRGWIKRAAFVGTGVLPLMILLTQSRGALIALVASGLVFFIAYSNGRRIRTVLTAVAVLILIVPFVPESAWRRFGGMKELTSEDTIREADPEGSADARYNIWRVARVIIAENPMTGVGLGAYALAHSQYSERINNVPPAARGGKDTHSTYLNIAAETGLPGLVLFLSMIAMVAVPAESTRRRAKGTPHATHLLALELGLLAFMLAGVFGSFGRLSFLYIQLALIWATTDLTKRELAEVAAQPGSRSSNVPPTPAVLRSRTA